MDMAFIRCGGTEVGIGLDVMDNVTSFYTGYFGSQSCSCASCGSCGCGLNQDLVIAPKGHSPVMEPITEAAMDLWQVTMELGDF